MSLNASYAPHEPSADYWNGVTHLAGDTVICGFTYGILFTLYVLCLDAIIPQLKKKTRRSWAIFHIVYLSLILALIGTETILEDPQRSHSYTGPVAMLAESAALYSIIGIIFIGCYFRQNPAGNLILPLLGNLERISPMMIIYRISIGRGWTHKTLRQVNSSFAVSTIRFNGRPTMTTNTTNHTSTLGVFGSEHPTETENAEGVNQKDSDVALVEKGLSTVNE